MTEPSTIERVIGKAKRKLARGLGVDAPVEVSTPLEPHESERNGRRYKLFFMTGFPRSGTNWCGAVLNRHPKIHISGEYHFEMLANGFRDLWKNPWQMAAAPQYKGVAEEAMRESIRRILVEGAHARPEAEWIGDRTPRWFDVLLPGAPHMMMLRDPRDILVSFLHHDLSKGGFLLRLTAVRKELEALRERFLADENLFKNEPQLLMANETYVRAALQQMKFFAERGVEAIEQDRKGELGAPLLLVRYEALHDNTEAERGRMYEFLGLDPAEATPLDEQSYSKPGLKEDTPTGMFRGGRVGDWRTYFTEDARRWFEDEIGELSRALGYPLEDWELSHTTTAG
ncbi:MAG: sulfotransferase [Planctomycetota bacterium]